MVLLSSSPTVSDAYHVVDLLADHGAELAWAVIKGTLLWGGPALMLALVLFLVGTRRGWVDIRGRKQRIARVLYALVLFLGFVPLIASAGVAHELAKSTVKVVRSEVRGTQSLQLCGGALVAPVVLAHLVAQGEYDEATAAALSWSVIENADVEFLLSEPTRRQALEALSESLIRAGLDKIPGYREAKSEAVSGFIAGVVERKLAGAANERLASYNELFDDVHADANGALGFTATADAVGLAFFERTVEPLIRGPYHSLRLQLGVGALLLLLAAIALIQGVGRLLIKEQATAD